MEKLIKNNLLINLWMLAVIASLATGCLPKVKFAAKYDEIVDQSLHQVKAKTTAHIKKIIDNKGQGEGAYKNSKAFYSAIKGEVEALVVRAETLEEGLKKTPLTDNFKALSMQYDDLELLHQTPYNKDVILKARQALDQSFRAIVKHLIYLKWNQEQPANN